MMVTILFLVAAIAVDLLATNMRKHLKMAEQEVEQRKRAEKALGESEEQYRFLVNNTGDDIMRLDRNSMIVFASQTAKRFHGYESDEIINTSGMGYVHPEDRAKNFKVVKEIIETGIPGRAEYRLQRKDGSYMWVEATGNRVYNKSGEPELILIQRDITERKQAEEAINQRNAELTTLNQIGQALSKLAEPAEILERIFTEIGKVLDNSSLYIALFDSESGYISFPVYMVEGVRHDPAGRHLGAGITDYIIRNNVPFVVEKDMEGALKKHGLNLLGKPSCAYIGVPIHKDDKVIGVIALQDYKHENVYNDHHLELLTTIATQAYSSLENSRLYKAIQQELEERKRAEEQVLQSEITYRGLLDSLAEAVYILDETGTFIDINQGAERMYGFVREELIGKTPALVSADGRNDLNLVMSQMQQAYHGTSQVLEFWGRRKNGQIFPKEVHLYPGTYYDRKAIIAIAQDITERKQAEEQISQNEKKYRELFQINKDGIAIFPIIPDGLPGNFIEVNDAAPKMIGYTREEMLQLSPMMIEPFTTQEQLQARQIEFELKGTINFETVLLHKNGHRVHTEITAQMIQYEGKPAVMNIVRDVSDRKHAEEAALESEEKFKRVIEHSFELISETDDQGRFVYVAQNYKGALGYTPEELLGTLASDLLHPDDLQTAVQEYAKSLEKGTSTFDLRIKHKDGSWRWFECVNEIYSTTQGEMRNAVFSHDITDQKHHEIEMQAIAGLSAALRTSETRAEMLPVIIEQLTILFNCDVASIELIDPLTEDTILVIAHGIWLELVGTRQKGDSGINAVIRQTRQPYFTVDLEHETGFNYSGAMYKDIRGAIGTPLFAQDNLIGFIWIGRTTEYAESDIRVFAAITDIAANAIHRATLHERTKQDAAELEMAYDSTLEGWAHELELRDQETEGHTRRVVQMTLDLATEMGISRDELENVRRGALLHDIGKMGIPDSILHKPGSLDEREWEIMRQHPEYAYRLLEPIEYLRPALNIPYYHHERWDGTGYPNNLKGEEIPLEARIFAVIDVWDALRSDRPYRPAWPQDKVKKHITEQSGRHFDPHVVQSFFEMLGVGRGQQGT
jgi:PAS domain S-box-containing protein